MELILEDVNGHLFDDVAATEETRNDEDHL
jgi:hypothetical protein